MATNTPRQDEAREFILSTVQQALESLKSEIDQEPNRICDVAVKPNASGFGTVTLTVRNPKASIPNQNSAFVFEVFGHMPGDYPHVVYKVAGDGFPKQEGEFPLPGIQTFQDTTIDQIRDHVRDIYEEAKRKREIALNRGRNS